MATFTLYLPDRILKRVDEVRGLESRSLAIRAMIEQALAPESGYMGAATPKDQRSPGPTIRTKSFAPGHVVSEAELQELTPEAPQEPSKAQRAEAVVKAKGLPVDRASAFRSATQ